MSMFITETYFKEKAGISKNTDAQLIKNAIIDAQEERLSTIVGWNFYNHLLSGFTASSLTADELTLVNDFIKPMVAKRAAISAYVDTDQPITSKGPVQGTGDYINKLNPSEISPKLARMQSSAYEREQLLIAYLRENKDLFPEFTVDNKFFKKPNGDSGNQINVRIV